MTNVQNNPNCALDPNTKATTTARVGDIASLPLEYFLDNATWPDPYTLTSTRIGIDYSTNPNAGIYLSNATSPFASIVTGSYIANSTSITNATSGKNTADTAITFTYDTYADEASRAMGLGNTPASFAGTPVTPSYLPAVQYPFATSTATTSLNKLSSGTTTVYSVYTPFSDYQEDTRGTITTYIRINGTLVATYTYQPSQNATAGTATPQSATGTLTYIHQNYLGTPVLETNTKGDILNVSLTDVNGNYILRDVRNDGTYHNKGYTGHEFDDLTQLTYAHARYLDTRTHTFTSVDPMYYDIPSVYLTDPQQMNSYGYARNNPVLNLDPTGASTKSLLDGINNAWYTDQIAGIGRKSDSQDRDYNSGQRIGDALAMVTGTLEVLTGSAMDIGGGALELASVGVASPVVIPIEGVGTAVVVHGASSAMTAATNFTKSNVTGTVDTFKDFSPQNLGKAGEEVAGVSGQKEKININGRDRIPDDIKHDSKAVVEVKNTSKQSLTSQIKDSLQYANNNSYKMVLYTRENTILSKPLQTLVNNGTVSQIKMNTQKLLNVVKRLSK